MTKSGTPLLHIGYHKTGTKWLERQLFRADHPLFYMTTPMRDWCDRFVLENPFEFDVGELRAEYDAMTRADRVLGRIPVLQMERLSGHPHSGGFDSRMIADRLKAVFPDARVLIVVREQIAMIVSCYKEGVDASLGIPLDRYLNPPTAGNRLVPTFNLRHFAYHHLVGYYQGLFGREHVRVLPYELLAQDPQAFVTAIAGLAGREAPTGYDTDPVHRSLGGFACSLRWRLNRVLLRSTLNPTGWTESAWTRSRCNRFARALSPGFLDRIVDRRMEARVRLKAGDGFRASNRRLAEITGIDLARFGYAL